MNFFNRFIIANRPYFEYKKASVDCTTVRQSTANNVIKFKAPRYTLRFLKLFPSAHNLPLLQQKTIITLLLLVLCALLIPSTISYAQDTATTPSTTSTQNATEDKTSSGEPDAKKLTTINEDWRQNSTEEKPQFDLQVTSSHPDIEELLKKHLELYKYRMLADLSNLELRRLLEYTEKNITTLTGTQGYFSPDIQIKLIPSDQRTEGSLLPLITIHVDPGEITTISELELLFEGDIADSQTDILISSLRRRLRWGWAMREKDSFTQSGWGNAKSNMLTRLTSQYYAAGKIARSKATIDPETNTAKLSITLDSGARFYLGEYKIETLERYSERLVRNFARLREGDDYLLDELNNAQQRLMESGYFDAVYVYVLPEDPHPEKADIHITLREAYYQQMTIGPGYSTDSGARLTFKYRHNEVPILGWQLNSSLNIDQDKQHIDFSLLSIPNDDYWRWGTSGKLANEEQNNERTKSIQLNYGKSYTSAKVDRSYFVQYDRAQTKNLTNKELSDVRAISLNTALTWRYFNNLISPRSGWGVALELGGGSTLGNSSTPFLRVNTKAQLLLPFEHRRNGHIILRGNIGGVFIKEGYPIPKTLLFLTGGDKTVRGYAYESISVNGVNDEVTSAGKYMLVGSIEYQRPIRINDRVSNYSWAAFIDTGAVTNRWDKLNFNTGVGAGVRWKSPVGPLNADLAYGLKSNSIRLHFNIGFT
ncbi:MAG: autotransporter assembly complex protein TamA, partial [Saezia sp.]